MNSLQTTSDSSFADKTATIPAAHRSSGAWLFLLVVLSVVIAGLAVVAGLLPRQLQRASLVQTTRDLAIPTVAVVQPTAGKVDTTMLLTAEIKPFVEAAIYARANGYVKRRLVDIGAKVEAGQLLAELDTPELLQEIAQATAQLTQAEAALTLAQTTAERFERLIKDDAVSQQEATEKRGDLAVKQANVAAAKANVSRLQDMLSFAKVTAPFAGSITMRRTEVGDLVTANATASIELFHIAQLDKLRVFVRVPQSIVRTVSVGSTAEVLFADLPKQVFAAKIIRTAGSLATESRTLLVELELDNAKGELLTGSFAQVRFTNADAAAPLTLPANTLIFRAQGAQVAVEKDGKVELRDIKMGRDHGPVFEVISGVAINDKVIINPPDALVTGATVRVAAKAAEH
jgi:RND family efflux transporter MFP subunit